MEITEHTSKSALVAELEGKLDLIATKQVGNNHWYVAIGKDGKPFIGLNLLITRKKRWCYKSMQESDHPYYYDCPEKFLPMAEVSSDVWRKGVERYHNHMRNLKRLREGSEIVLFGHRYVLMYLHYPDKSGRPKWVAKSVDGKVYEIKHQYLKQCSIEKI